MTLHEIQGLVTAGESETAEFKKTTAQRIPAAKTVCAMLNGSGGFVLFGVTPDSRRIVGQGVSERTLEEVAGELRRIEPFVPIHPETLPLAPRASVVMLRVPRGASRPYTYDGRAYLRHGSETVDMPRSEYERLLVEQMHPAHRWELQEASGLGIHDLDAAEITRTVDEAIRRGRMDEPGTRDPAALLQGLRLAREDGALLNAAVALFARPDVMLPHYAQCVLRLARFRGTTMTEFEDNRQVHGNTFALLAEAQAFMRRHLPVAGRIVPDLFERADDPLYPPEALREAVANAVCHRDYGIGGGSVSIAIFDDRLEITSVGRLPFGQTPDVLIRQHTSKPWNPLIAGVFYRRGLIESWGRGTLKMIELTEKADLLPPEFIATGEEVTVRFRPQRYVSPARVERDLSPLQRQLLQVLGEVGPSSLSRIEGALPSAPARRTIQENLDFLRRLGLIELDGRGRGAYWFLVPLP